MLDLTGIMASSIILLFIAFRAIALDRIMPWFQTLSPRAAAKAEGASAWTRRAAPGIPAGPHAGGRRPG